jgi:hypothetical protein
VESKGITMSIEQIRASITGRVWQAIAQSGVDTSAIPHDSMNILVNAITNGVLLEVNSLLDTATTGQAPGQPTAGTETEEGERVLWEGRPFLSLTESYRVTNERIRITKGLLSKEREDIELFRIQDIDHTQNLSERMLNIGDITMHSGDTHHQEFVLRNVSNPNEVHEIIRRAVLEARKRHRVAIRDDL